MRAKLPMGSRRYEENVNLHTCAMVCSSSTQCPHAALISSQVTLASPNRPNLAPFTVAKGPAFQMWNTSFHTLVRCSDSSCADATSILARMLSRSCRWADSCSSSWLAARQYRPSSSATSPAATCRLARRRSSVASSASACSARFRSARSCCWARASSATEAGVGASAWRRSRAASYASASSLSASMSFSISSCTPLQHTSHSGCST
mmetsp:Transcript_16645/g.49794  ORF Transcript_16645/g.49794 Transcript_16645/m.49794 type:complete len:207 (+) Transcript_16645:764-1384(+)